MIKLSRVFKDYQESGAMNALVNIHAAIDDHTFLTKSGDLLMILKVEGVDYECLEAPQLDRIARCFEAGVRTFDEHFRLYQYLIKGDHAHIPHGEYDDPVIREAVANRAAYLRGKNLHAVEISFAVVYEGSRQASSIPNRLASFAGGIRAMLSTKQKIAALDEQFDRAREALRNKVDSFVIQLRDCIKIEVLHKKRAFAFLRRLLNYAPYKSDGVGLRYDEFVDYQACGSSLECHRDHLRLDDYFVRVLTLKEPPAQTFPHLLKGLLEIPAQFVIASEWKRAGSLAVRRLIQSKRRHFHNSKASLLNYLNTSETAPKDMLIDNSATALVAELGSCLQALEVNGNPFGEFSMTVVLYDEDHARLKRAVAECFKVFAPLDAQLTEERYNLLNAFLAVLPGNHAFNLRKMWLTGANYADLSFLFAPDMGATVNPHLGTEYLAAFETNHRTSYFFNLHHQDVAHAVIFGGTGSGKSFLVNFLLTHLQKYGPRTYIFDLGGSYQSLTQLFKGTYVPIGSEKHSFTINPLSLPPTPQNIQFLCSFVRVLAESNGDQITGQDQQDLYEQIKNMYAVEQGQRRLLTLGNILNRRLRQGLQPWIQGGQYGHWFDNTNDNLTFAPFQTFDFEGMDKIPQVLEPLLFYILHRANAAVYDDALAATFKVFVMDEAWRFMRHPAIRLYILEALKTWRKKTAGMILATQSTDDLLRSDMLAPVIESCPTKMFLANPDVDRRVLREVFHLNGTEAELVAGLIPKRQMLLKRPDLAKILNLNVDQREYWLYTNNPHDNQKKREAFERYGFEQGLEFLARSNS